MMFDWEALGVIQPVRNSAPHTYSFYYFNKVSGRHADQVFNSREAAVEKMYRICDKSHMRIVKIWNDKHCKTYFTDTGAEFHINRMF